MKKTLTLIAVLFAMLMNVDFAKADAPQTKNISINTGIADWQYALTDRKTYAGEGSQGLYDDWNTYVNDMSGDWKETLGEHSGNHKAFYNSAYGMTNTDEVSWIGTNSENPVYTVFKVWIGAADMQFLNLIWSADNNTAAIVFNGVNYLTEGLEVTAHEAGQLDYGGWGAFTTTNGYNASIDLTNSNSSSGFGEGWLYFVVQNVNSNVLASPMGLYVQGNYSQTPTVEQSSATPEPATLAMIGFGLVGAGWFARKKAKTER